jgi:hypothetical protein
MAKTAPYPPCTVTAFWLKHQDSDRCSRRVTLTEPYRRAVSCKANLPQVLIVPGLPTRAQEFCSPSLQPSRRCKTHAFFAYPDSAILISLSYDEKSRLIYRDFSTMTTSLRPNNSYLPLKKSKIKPWRN